ncbi:MAG: ABC transporter permease [Saprospiraceae bacterium]
MFRLTLKRFLQFLPGLFIISILAFVLNSWAPGDGAEIYLNTIYKGNFRAETDSEEVYYETRSFLGLDRPLFYFSVYTLGDLHPDISFKDRDIQETAEILSSKHRKPKAVTQYAMSLIELKKIIRDNKLSGEIYRISRTLFQQYREKPISANLELLNQWMNKNPEVPGLRQKVENVRNSFQRINTTPVSKLHFLPSITWNGWKNQYHLWISSWIKGSGGTSFADLQPVGKKILKALKWTLVLNLISILLTYLLALPLGVLGAYYRDSNLDKILTITLLSWFSIPGFWMATMAIVFFTTPEYGLDLFPTMGPGYIDSDMNWWTIFQIRIHHLTLPIICLTYGSLAFTARQMRQSMIHELDKTYIKLAKTKGLTEWQIVIRHALPNAIFPILTMFGGILPSLLAGSVVIEYIFNIPGMGKLMVDAIFGRDWPVVNSVLMIAAFLTMLGILISDLLYYWVDPRVKMDEK